jgi:hypothetical protein
VIHENEVNVRAKPYFEAMLKEADVLGPAHVSALKEQRARQLSFTVGDK